jgi:hypothetical protein
MKFYTHIFVLKIRSKLLRSHGFSSVKAEDRLVGAFFGNTVTTLKRMIISLFLTKRKNGKG